MELESNRRERGNELEWCRGFIFSGGGGVDGEGGGGVRVLSTLGHGAPEVTEHSFPSDDPGGSGAEGTRSPYLTLDPWSSGLREPGRDLCKHRLAPVQ